MNRHLIIASGGIVVLGLALFVRLDDAGQTLPTAGTWAPERAIEAPSTDASARALPATPTATVPAISDRDLVAEIITELGRLNTLGPAAKGAVDDHLHQLRERLTSANVAEVARSLTSPELVSPVGTVVLEQWMAVDPSAAGSWISAHPAATDHHAWLVAQTLSGQPALFIAFCEGLDDSEWSHTFLDYSGRELLQRSPAAAVLLAESLPPGERRTQLLQTIAHDWMLHDPASARAWINHLGETTLRHQLVLVGAQSHASNDPLGALEWLLAQEVSDDVTMASIRAVARTWLHTADPEATARIDALLAASSGAAAAAVRSP
jgi:hypothetical protein